MYNNRQLSVVSIGEYAFKGCDSLTSVTIQDSVTEIGKWAFEECNSLTSVTIPDSVTEIGRGAFFECSSLISIIIPNSITEIREDVFSGCCSLTSVTIPDTVTKIGGSAFRGCSSLTCAAIPNSVTYMGIRCFSGCSSLKTMTLPDSLTSIQYGLFENCSHLETLVLPGSISRILQYYEIIQYNGNIEVGEYTFSGCQNLTNLCILNSDEILSVGYYYRHAQVTNGALWYKEDYENSIWKEWTRTITYLYIDRPLKKEIWYVENLVELELGESIETVQVDMNKSEKLSTIVSHALIPPTLPGMSNAQYMNVNVFVPEEALEAYKADKEWGKFWNLQASGVDGVKVDSKREVIGRYDLNGRAVSEDYNGFVIVRFSDGSCKKMLNR